MNFILIDIFISENYINAYCYEDLIPSNTECAIPERPYLKKKHGHFISRHFCYCVCSNSS